MVRFTFLQILPEIRLTRIAYSKRSSSDPYLGIPGRSVFAQLSRTHDEPDVPVLSQAASLRPMLWDLSSLRSGFSVTLAMGSQLRIPRDHRSGCRLRASS